MDIEQDVSVWKNLHASTELTSDRTRPSPIILAFLERNIVPNTATRPGERMALEVGVGIGRNIVHLAELGYCDRFVGVDMTDEALAKARQLEGVTNSVC